MVPKNAKIDDNASALPPRRKRWTYTNAQDVLPEELLAAIQEHYRGGYIYIPPPPNGYFNERRKLVLALHLRGVPTREIAGMANVTPRRVRQILAQVREKSKM